MRSKNAFLLLLIGYGVYAALFIFRTSVVVGGQRYFVLFDDAMVSMRYARNLAHGAGLVWNPGSPPVEGFSNLLWTLYMATVHLLPVTQRAVSLVIQLTGALALIVNLVVVKRIAERVSHGSASTTMAAVVLTAFYLPLNNWAMQGTEVGVLALLVSGSALLALRSLDSETLSIATYILLGLGTLVRLDMIVPFLAVQMFLMVVQPRFRLRHALAGGCVLVTCLIAQTAFRWFYYGEILPNTYYLKMAGYPAWLRMARGLWVFLGFLSRMTLAVLVIPFVFRLARRNRGIALLLTVTLAQFAYSVYVGGDAWEWWGGSNRYISIAMPVFLVAFACGLDDARQQWLLHARTESDATWGARFRRSGLVMPALVAMSLLCLNAIRGPRSLANWLLISEPLHVDDNRTAIEVGEIVSRITTNGATVAVVSAGTTAYFMNRQAVDILGKTDRTIAREPMRQPASSASLLDRLDFFYPGHLKYDYAYSIGDLKPDIIAQLWNPEEAAPYLDASYRRVNLSGHRLGLRIDSSQILWEHVQQLASSR